MPSDLNLSTQPKFGFLLYKAAVDYMKSDKLTLHIRSYEIKLDQKAQIRLYGIRLYEMRPNDIR